MGFMFQHEAEEYMYTRGKNPTVTILEKKLAQLEGRSRLWLSAAA